MPAGRRRDPLDAVAAEIDHARAVETDVTDPASVDRLFARVAAVHGRLDLPFDNAGIFTPAAPVDAVRLAIGEPASIPTSPVRSRARRARSG